MMACDDVQNCKDGVVLLAYAAVVVFAGSHGADTVGMSRNTSDYCGNLIDSILTPIIK